MHKIFVRVLTNHSAQGTMPIAYSHGYGQIVRVKKVLKKETIDGIVRYTCQTPNGDVLLYEPREYGEWHVEKAHA